MTNAISTRRTTELSIAQVATDLAVHPATVRRYIASGLLPARRLGPKLIRVKASDLERFKNGLGGVA